MPFMAKILQRAGLSGFEGLSVIPGSIGGAVLGNAGAFGGEISDLLIDIEVYDTESGQVLRISKEDCGFSYRHSIFKERNCIILSVRFGLYDSDPDSVLAEMNRCAKARKSTQPTDKLSLGSGFKRPRSDLSAARLIDSCGLKGYSVGGAEISKKHAGFIINNGGATAGDYIALSDYAADCVYQKYGICLEREVEIM